MILFIIRSQPREFRIFSTNPAYLSEMAEASFPLLSVSPPGGLTKMAIDEQMARSVHLNALGGGLCGLCHHLVCHLWRCFEGECGSNRLLGGSLTAFYGLFPQNSFFLFRVCRPANIYYVLATDQQVCVGGGEVASLILLFFVHTPAVLISPPQTMA